MSMKRMGLSGVIVFAIFAVFQGCTILGEGTQQPTQNYVLNSLYSDETQSPAVGDLSREIAMAINKLAKGKNPLKK